MLHRLEPEVSSEPKISQLLTTVLASLAMRRNQTPEEQAVLTRVLTP